MLARASCHALDPNLRAMALARIDKTTDRKITAVAYEFHEILYRKGKVVPLEIVEQLSLANLYGWMAYEIYDDALDDENREDASSVPCANFFLRALTELYATLDARITGTRYLFDRTMNLIDGANAWEQKYCRIITNIAPPNAIPPNDAISCALPRFGDHQTLADRSIGHAMGPLTEMLFAGYTTGSEEYTDVESFFRHYLIARQLHDDAHDWADDLISGRVNSVAALVLSRFPGKDHDCGKIEIASLTGIIPDLKRSFWKETIDDVVRMIDSHLDAARGAREHSAILADTDFMENALHNLGSSAQRTIAERNKALVFLEDYKMK